MENAKQAYDVFNRLWQKVPRSVRLDRENHQLMLDVRAFFDGLMEAAKRAAIVDAAKGGAPVAEGADGPDPIRQVLRLLRTLDRREWEMVKSIVDLFHTFSTEDLLDVIDIARDVSCPRCGEWLDDDDLHENCPVPEEDDRTLEEGDRTLTEDLAADAASAAGPAPLQQTQSATTYAASHLPAQTSLPAIAAPAESGPKTEPHE